ncbi:MAG: DNA polymerase III subunit delta [Candidatus Zixiibacteriota bacterium]
MTPSELVTSVGAGKFAPAYYFWGSEDYRIIEAEKYIAHQFLPDALYATNFRRLDGRKTSCADLLAELAVYPMLGERQMFAVSDIQHYKPTDLERILRMIAPGDVSRIIVFSTPSVRKPKKDSAFLRNITKVAVDIEFRKLSHAETASQIQRKFARHKIKIEPEALRLLSELVAGNRGAVETETDKLIDLKESGAVITADDVRLTGVGYAVFSVFDLGEQIVTRNVALALKQVQALIADGNTPSGILTILFGHILSLYQVKNGRRLEPFRRWLEGKFRAQAEQFDNRTLEQMMIDITETIAETRKTGANDVLLLEALIIKLLSEEKKAGEKKHFPGRK